MAMKSQSRFKLTVYLLGLAGMAFFIALLVREGITDVFAVVAAAGWGLVAATTFHVIPEILDTAEWRVLFPAGRRPRLRDLAWMRWIGESINNLVPAAQVGGDLVRTRLAVINGTRMPVAAASVIVDMTVNVFIQIIFTLTGVALLIGTTRQMNLAKPAIAGALVSILAISGFYAVQRFGGIRWIAGIISRLTGGDWQPLVQNVQELDREIRSVYSRRRDIMTCAAWAMTSWVSSAGEIWITLYVLGMQTSFVHALIFESISQGFRSAVFFIPGGLGVQEGGYLFVAGMLGIPGHAALAMALIRRIRELAFGVPGILVWQFLEGKRLHHAMNGSALPVAARAASLSKTARS